ncbi:MAG: hypothetical protein CEN88_297 [Candidatus Berkelbacteria bacterium Licking1014_2]|uniref:SHSP domain-containing protein n=1 Tax=Candidatus Berkelbacteria bacterium Licking1014_2 TaxID=2017146 RepID=A0A554LUY8_9BACT|nr:MAG: hypothetical protein CEN88_297 [Candidatus Berkelbacteria bacterium Licking1014_2]
MAKEIDDNFLAPQADWTEDYDGQLAVDVYQNEDEVVLRAPIAGVKPEDLEVSITDEVVAIKGRRQESSTINKENYFCQECYWGGFSRSYVLPMAVDSDKAEAELKDGILTIRLPKLEKSKAKTISVKKAA